MVLERRKGRGVIRIREALKKGGKVKDEESLKKISNCFFIKIAVTQKLKLTNCPNFSCTYTYSANFE